MNAQPWATLLLSMMLQSKLHYLPLAILMLLEPSLAQPAVSAPVAQQKLLREAEALLAAGRLDEGEARALSAVAANEKNPIPWNVLGQVRFARKKWKQAIGAFERARALLPEDPRLHVSIGICYFEWGRISEAKAILGRAVNLDPRVSRPHLFLGRLARARGEAREAEKELRLAFTLDQKDWLTSYYLGLFLFRQSRLPEAIAMFEHCLKLMPDQPSAHLNLGLALTRMGKKKKGLRHLERFKSLTDVSSQDQQMRARVSNRLRAARADMEAGNLGSALAVMIEARELAPEVPSVHRFLAAIYARQGRVAEARDARDTLDRLLRARKKP